MPNDAAAVSIEIPATAAQPPPAPAPLVCPGCGSPNVPDALFCEACGYDFIGGAPAPASAPSAGLGTEPQEEMATAPSPPAHPSVLGESVPPEAAPVPLEPTDATADSSVGAVPAAAVPSPAQFPHTTPADSSPRLPDPPAGTPGSPPRAPDPSAPATGTAQQVQPPPVPAAPRPAPAPAQLGEATPSGSAQRSPASPVVEWVAELWIDPDWYSAQGSSDPLPSPGLPDIVPLVKQTNLIGRVSRSRNIYPEVDCELDNGTSRRHARLTTDGARWWIEDLESANGTFVGSASGPLPAMPIPRGRTELGPDARIYVGAWTRIVIRQATADEKDAYAT